MIIHQIWIGPAAPPHFWMNTVKQFAENYGYTYMLWDDTTIKDLRPKNAAILERFMREKRWPGAADIIRYEVMYTYGGVYIDADTVVLKPAEFHAFLQERKERVFMGCEYEDCSLIANGTLGAPKHSSFFRDMLAAMPAYSKAHWDEPDYKQVGPYFLTDFVKTQKAVELVPRTVFYPRTWHGIVDPWLHLKTTVPPESLLFQYGYSTNGFNRIFKQRNLVFLAIVVAAFFVIWMTRAKLLGHVCVSVGVLFVAAVIIKKLWIH